jgi:hypothetical protein
MTLRKPNKLASPLAPFIGTLSFVSIDNVLYISQKEQNCAGLHSTLPVIQVVAFVDDLRQLLQACPLSGALDCCCSLVNTAAALCSVTESCFQSLMMV